MRFRDNDVNFELHMNKTYLRNIFLMFLLPSFVNLKVHLIVSELPRVKFRSYGPHP